MLECKNITKYIGNFVLKDIQFTLEPGYILGVIGRNGSGKSTLLRVLLGSYLLFDPYDEEALHTMQRENLKRSSGDVLLLDYSLIQQEVDYRARLAYVLSETPFDLQLTSGEAGKFYGGYYNSFSMERYLEYLKKYGVPATLPIENLSRGQRIKQQLAFARSYDALLYILDEPTANLDEEFRGVFYQELQDIMSSGDKYMILASHLVEELELLCDYVLWLKKEQLADKHATCAKQYYYGTVEELKDSFSLVQATYEEVACYKQWIVGSRCNEVHQEYLLRKPLRELKRELHSYSRQVFLKELMYYIEEGEDTDVKKDYD